MSPNDEQVRAAREDADNIERRRDRPRPRARLLCGGLAVTSRIIVADALDGLAQLPDGSVRCCVTSPPYWGLRDYGITGQLGLESTPQEYVERMVAVFREVRRVLQDDGTLWLNLGDSYAAGGRGGGMAGERGEKQRSNAGALLGPKEPPPGLKPKDLVGIPWRVAFALQADGWWLRSDIIWAKPNPMPESVTDRPTKAHEYLFLLSKSQRYFYDAKAIAEPAAGDTCPDPRLIDGFVPKSDNGKHAGMPQSAALRKQDALAKATYTGFNGRWDAKDGAHHQTRNARSVWTIPTSPFPEAHFATFPEALPERCVRAGSAEGDTVLDPFHGAGTVGVVCKRLNRAFVGIELNPDYAAMAERRIRRSPAHQLDLPLMEAP